MAQVVYSDLIEATIRRIRALSIPIFPDEKVIKLWIDTDNEGLKDADGNSVSSAPQPPYVGIIPTGRVELPRLTNAPCLRVRYQVTTFIVITALGDGEGMTAGSGLGESGQDAIRQFRLRLDWGQRIYRTIVDQQTAFEEQIDSDIGTGKRQYCIEKVGLGREVLPDEVKWFDQGFWRDIMEFYFDVEEPNNTASATVYSDAYADEYA